MADQDWQQQQGDTKVEDGTGARPQSTYDSKFLEQMFGGTGARQDAVMQVLAHFDQMEQQARTARQTVWGLALIQREQTAQIISSLPPIVASLVVEEFRRSYPQLGRTG